jgi:hypothetical protein
LAQSSEAASSDCLVVLKASSSDFATTAQAHKALVIAHSDSNLNWWLKNSATDCSVLQGVQGVEMVATPLMMMVTLNPGATLPKTEIEKLGGIVYHDFAGISAASVVLPSDKLTALAALPGIKQVREDRAVSPARKPGTTK